MSITKTNFESREKIENAICKLEKIICDELGIDLGHEVLKPLDDWRGLRDKIERHTQISNALRGNLGVCHETKKDL